ncbi:MAG: hypothetical protein PF450_01930, partial [Bacteroidales bacterium]|nr:hypothetical protein [Bacteroidales bacterium]
MESKLLSGAELARYANVSKAAISTGTREGRLHREEISKKYDVNHSTNLAFINKNRVKIVSAELMDDSEEISTDLKPRDVLEGMENLYMQNLQV